MLNRKNKKIPGKQTYAESREIACKTRRLSCSSIVPLRFQTKRLSFDFYRIGFSYRPELTLTLR